MITWTNQRPAAQRPIGVTGVGSAINRNALREPGHNLAMMSEVSFRGSPAWLEGQAKTTLVAQKPQIITFHT